MEPAAAAVVVLLSRLLCRALCCVAVLLRWPPTKLQAATRHIQTA